MDSLQLLLFLWTPPSFINNSCIPNKSRLQAGREEMAESWGFCFESSRCKLESILPVTNQEIVELGMGVETRVDARHLIEEFMKRYITQETYEEMGKEL